MSEDTISRKAAVNAVGSMLRRKFGIGGDLAEITLAGLPSAQPETHEERTETHGVCLDAISRQAAIEAIEEMQMPIMRSMFPEEQFVFKGMSEALSAIKDLPSAQPGLCEYYALCRHGRDENKLRKRLKYCEYCNEDSDGYVTPIEKNNHAFVRFGMNGWELSMKANGWHGEAKINYCPMCGRRLQ